mgnify:CR=1 FL=1
MRRYKNKFMKVINFIRNEGKFEYGDMVKIKQLKDELGVENYYTNYEGKLGIITSVSYDKKDYIFGVKFEDGNHIDFKASEPEKIEADNPIRYKKLSIEY